VKEVTMSTRLLRGFALAISLVSVALGSASAQTITIRAEHDENTTSITHRLLTEMAADIARESGGKIKMDVHPSASLSGGKITTMIQNVQAGSEELGFIASSVYTTVDPRVGVFSLPFLTGGIDDLERVARKSDVARKLWAEQSSRNLTVVDAWSRALRQTVNNRREIRVPEDARGLRFRVPEIKLWVDAFKAMGAIPVPMPFSEIPTAMQLRTIDGAERPSEFLLSEKWWEMAKFVTMLNYTGDVIMVAFNSKFWNGLDAATQKLLVAKIQAYGDKKLAEEKVTEEKVIATLKDKGVKVTILTPQEVQQFRTAMRPVWDENTSKIGKDLIDQAVKAVSNR